MASSDIGAAGPAAGRGVTVNTFGFSELVGVVTGCFRTGEASVTGGFGTFGVAGKEEE